MRWKGRIAANSVSDRVTGFEDWLPTLLERALDLHGHEIESGGVRVVIDEKSALYLVGTTLDYVDSLMESGFKIQNPNAKNTCGCGNSFGA